MSVKIHVSYQTEEEEAAILALLRPVMDCFKVKKSTDKPPYKHMYFIPKKPAKPCGTRDCT